MNVSYIVLAILVIALLRKCYLHLNAPPPAALSHLPIVGVPPGALGRLRAGFSSFLQVAPMLAEGYARYGKRAQAYLIPNQFSGYIVALPASLVGEIKAASDSELCMGDAVEEENAMTHTFFMDVWKSPWHVTVIKDRLTTGNLGRLLPTLMDEIEGAFEDEYRKAQLGSGAGEWTEVDVWEWGLRVVARATHSMFVGQPLCRDQKFVTTCVDFSVGVVLSGWALRGVSETLRPWVAPFVTIRNRYRVSLVKRYLKPLILERMKIVEHNADPSNKTKLDAPNDYLYWSTLEAYRLGGSHYTIHAITIGLLIANFAAVHTTSLLFVDTMICIASFSSPSRPYQSDLRSELAAAASAFPGEPEWSNKKLALLHGLDSFVKETLRLYVTSAAGLMKIVKPADGFRFSNGLWLPKGAKICVPTYSLHVEDELYADAATFDGYRFSRPWKGEKDTGEERDARKASMLAVTDDYFSFGGGKHTCPGRFLAATEVKALMRYVLTNYEVRPIEGGRPKKVWFGINMMPAFGVKMGLRKRQA